MTMILTVPGHVELALALGYQSHCNIHHDKSAVDETKASNRQDKGMLVMLSGGLQAKYGKSKLGDILRLTCTVLQYIFYFLLLSTNSCVLASDIVFQISVLSLFRPRLSRCRRLMAAKLLVALRMRKLISEVSQRVDNIRGTGLR